MSLLNIIAAPFQRFFSPAPPPPPPPPPPPTQEELVHERVERLLDITGFLYNHFKSHKVYPFYPDVHEEFRIAEENMVNSLNREMQGLWLAGGSPLGRRTEGFESY